MMQNRRITCQLWSTCRLNCLCAGMAFNVSTISMLMTCLPTHICMRTPQQIMLFLRVHQPIQNALTAHIIAALPTPMHALPDWQWAVALVGDALRDHGDGDAIVKVRGAVGSYCGHEGLVRLRPLDDSAPTYTSRWSGTHTLPQAPSRPHGCDHDGNDLWPTIHSCDPLGAFPPRPRWLASQRAPLSLLFSMVGKGMGWDGWEVTHQDAYLVWMGLSSKGHWSIFIR